MSPEDRNQAMEPHPTAAATRMGAGEQRECESCGEPLVFARTKEGNIAPITLRPKATGNVLLFRAGGVVECRVLPKDINEALSLIGVPKRLNHFADCPGASEFR